MEKVLPIDIRRKKAKKIYDEWVDKGFCVEDISCFYENNDSTKKRYESVISTPWLYKGKGKRDYEPVKAYTVSVFPPDRGKDMSSIGETEVLLTGYFVSNDIDTLENITLDLEKRKTHLYDKNLNSEISKEEADNTISDIIQIANNLPHVALWDEFIPLEVVFEATYGRDFDVDVSTSDYINDYLVNVEKSFLEYDGTFFIGKITSLRDMHYAYESIPKEDRETMLVENADCTVEEYLDSLYNEME